MNKYILYGNLILYINEWVIQIKSAFVVYVILYCNMYTVY